MSKLHRLVYFSRCAMPDAADFSGEMRQILEGARRRNAKSGITGALLFNKGGFAQILEGPLPAVNETFNRIQMDRRHAGVIVLSNEEIPARSFGAWHMAFIGEESVDPRLHEIQVANDVYPTNSDAERICATIRRLLAEREAEALDDMPERRVGHGR